MENFDIYKDIAVRTQGDIYVGIVGPVRTGKSTFIKRFMELMVIPNIENSYKKQRAKDELPQFPFLFPLLEKSLFLYLL